MKLSIKNIAAPLLAIGVIATSTLASATGISDWALNDYNSSSKSGLLSYEIVTNNVKNNITRLEMCKLIKNLYESIEGKRMNVASVSPFTDTSDPAVTSTYFYGIVSGMSEKEFMPDRYVTRQELAKFFLNVMNSLEVQIPIYDGGGVSFPDKSEIAEWALPAVDTLTKYKVMSGLNDNTFSPTQNATIEQAIICTNRMYSLLSGSNHKEYQSPIVTSFQSNSQLTDWSVPIRWTPIPGASSYYVIVEDSKGNPIYSYSDVKSTEAVFSYAQLPNGQYKVTVGARIDTEDDSYDIFSNPVNFSYNHKPSVAQSQNTPVTAPQQAPQAQTQQSNQSQTKQPQIVTQNKDNTAKEEAVLSEAAKYVGIPYLWGGNSPEDGGMDCSGYAKYVYSKLGYTIKRIADDQLKFNGTYVTEDQLRPGDLVFFGSGNYASHVGIYVGVVDGVRYMVHAPSTGKNIQYASIDSTYYKSRYIGAKRILN